MTTPRLDLPFVAQAAAVGAAAALGLIAGLDPVLALASAFGAAFVMAVFANLSVGVALFALLASLDALPELGSSAAVVSKGVGLLLALSWLAVMTTKGDSRVDFFRAQPVLSYLLILFVAWSALSLLWSADTAAALESTYRYALNLALFPIVFAAIQERRHAAWIAWGFVAGAVLAGLYGMAVQPDASEDLDRLAGTIGDPNQLAAVMVAGMVIAAGLAGGRGSFSPTRTLAFGAACVCLLTTFLTLSRGGLVALVAVLVAALLFGGRWRSRALAFWMLAALAAVAYFGALAGPEARDRIFAADGGTGRTDIWTVGWRMVEAEPVLGVGSGNFEVSSVDYLLEPGALLRDEFIVDTPKVAHNIYLQILSELGIVGLTLFLALVGLSLVAMLQAAHIFERLRDPRAELLARAGAMAVAGLLAANFFISDQFSKQLWLLLGLGPALLGLARATEAMTRRPPHEPSSSRS